MTANEKTLTSLQVHYGLEDSHPSVAGKSFGGITHGGIGNVKKIEPMIGEEGSYYVSDTYGNSSGGKKWTDGTFSGVRSITMTANDKTLTSLQVHYGLEGSHASVAGKSYGGIGNVKKTYYLCCPDEYLVKMSGYTGWYLDQWGKKWYVVKSLTFHTNKRTLEPCGPQQGDYFETGEDGQIVGFFGSASNFLLDSIGIYMQLFP